MAEQAITEPEHRAYAEKEIRGLLGHDLDDLARLLDLAGDVLPMP